MEFSSAPNEKYQKLFDQFKEIETLPIKEWKVNHILAFFIKKYKETYGIDYQFKFNDPNPNKCYEVWRIKTLVARLSKDPEILKAYIDWVWEQKVSKAKKRFSSISYITGDSEVNSYKMNVLFANNQTTTSLNRSSFLPEKIKNIFAEFGLPMKTYGDLAFFYQSCKSEVLDNTSDTTFKQALLKIKEENFDLTVLEKIK